MVSRTLSSSSTIKMVFFRSGDRTSQAPTFSMSSDDRGFDGLEIQRLSEEGVRAVLQHDFPFFGPVHSGDGQDEGFPEPRDRP